MATLMRTVAKIQNNLSRLNQFYKFSIKQRFAQPTGSIFTSSKKKDSAITGPVEDTQVGKVEKVRHLGEKDENWISYGYNLYDRDEDEWSHHMIMFAAFTIPTAWIILFMAYCPSPLSWHKREAVLELARREQEGLPLICENLIDPGKINLPTDEELGDYDIVI